MSLEADVELIYAPDGLIWRLECPTEKVVETSVAQDAR